MLLIYTQKMDEFNGIFGNVKKQKMTKFYKNVRLLVGTKRNKSQYSKNLLNLMQLYAKMNKKQVPANMTPGLLAKHFTMKDYKELFSEFRHTLMGARSKKQQISNLYKLGQKTRTLQRYFLELNSENVKGLDLSAINKIEVDRGTRMIVDSDLVSKDHAKNAMKISNDNMNDFDYGFGAWHKQPKQPKASRGTKAVEMARQKRSNNNNNNNNLNNIFDNDSNDSNASNASSISGDIDIGIGNLRHPDYDKSAFSWIQS